MKINEDKINTWFKQSSQEIERLEKVLETHHDFHLIASKDSLNINIIRPKNESGIVISSELSFSNSLEKIEKYGIKRFKKQIEPILETTNGIYQFKDGDKSVEFEKAKSIYLENKINDENLNKTEFINSISEIFKTLEFIQEKIDKI